MCNTGVLQSNENAVEQNSMALRAVGAASSTMMALSTGATNLTVVNNMRNANAQLNSCHTDFMQLLTDDADSIEQVKQAFDEFDQKETELMEKGE